MDCMKPMLEEVSSGLLIVVGICLFLCIIWIGMMFLEELLS